MIEQLFAKGNQFNAFPVKVLYQFVSLSQSVPMQATVSVSSRNFKKAVHRNRIKRLLREAYRLQKSELEQKLEQHNVQLALFFIYTGKQLPVFKEISSAIHKLLGRLFAMELPQTSTS